MRIALALAGPLVALAVACGHSNDAVELRAQTGEDLARPSYDEPLPPRQTVRVGADAGAPPEETTNDGRAYGPPTGTTAVDVGQACPTSCWLAEPRASRPLVGDQLERFRQGVLPTLSGLRQCTANGGRWRRHPIVNLRFNRAGALTDVGVDTTGFDPEADDCMQQVVRGNVTMPSLQFDGPGTVRCAERCERVTRPPVRRR